MNKKIKFGDANLSSRSSLLESKMEQMRGAAGCAPAFTLGFLARSTITGIQRLFFTDEHDYGQRLKCWPAAPHAAPATTLSARSLVASGKITPWSSHPARSSSQLLDCTPEIQFSTNTCTLKSSRVSCLQQLVQ